MTVKKERWRQDRLVSTKNAIYNIMTFLQKAIINLKSHFCGFLGCYLEIQIFTWLNILTYGLQKFKWIKNMYNFIRCKKLRKKSKNLKKLVFLMKIEKKRNKKIFFNGNLLNQSLLKWKKRTRRKNNNRKRSQKRKNLQIINN